MRRRSLTESSRECVSLEFVPVPQDYSRARESDRKLALRHLNLE